MIRARDVWMARKVRTYHKGTATQSLLLGDVLGELGITDSSSIKVLGLTAWNVTPQGANSQFVFLETEETMTLSGVRCEATDFGTSSSLAGVKINIPDVLSRAYNGSNLTTTILAKISGSPYVAATVEQNYCVDWTVLWNVSADQ